MDPNIEKTHTLLLEASLPSTINDLKNPTKDYVISLIKAFLLNFNIDVDTIERATCEQQSCMLYPDFDIISIINLHAVMSQICERIFINDFCITDITSPGSKRLRRQVKFIANFLLYTTNKSADIDEAVKEICNKRKEYEDLIKRKKELLRAHKDKQLHIDKQQLLIEKYQVDAQKVRSSIEKHAKKEAELRDKINVMEEKKRKALEIRNAYKAESQKLQKAILEFNSEIVDSPEEYRNCLQNLEEENKAKVDERKRLEETYQVKKKLLEKYENILGFIQKHYEFPELVHLFEQLKNVSGQEETTKKQIELLKGKIMEIERKLSIQGSCGSTEVNEFHAHCKEKMMTLKNLHTEVLRKRKVTAIELEKGIIHYNKLCREKDELQSFIQKEEAEIAAFLKHCQKLYYEEITSEIELQKTLIDRNQKSNTDCQ